VKPVEKSSNASLTTGNIAPIIAAAITTNIIYRNQFLIPAILNTIYKLKRGIRDFHFFSQALPNILHNDMWQRIIQAMHTINIESHNPERKKVAGFIAITLSPNLSSRFNAELSSASGDSSSPKNHNISFIESSTSSTTLISSISASHSSSISSSTPSKAIQSSSSQ
jgi:hypothetical protein